MISKRRLIAGVGALVCVAGARPARAALPPISMARRNPVYPFGAVIVRGDSGEVLARGVNDSGRNPILHGEIACMTTMSGSTATWAGGRGCSTRPPSPARCA